MFHVNLVVRFRDNNYNLFQLGILFKKQKKNMEFKQDQIVYRLLSRIIYNYKHVFFQHVVIGMTL